MTQNSSGNKLKTLLNELPRHTLPLARETNYGGIVEFFLGVFGSV